MKKVLLFLLMISVLMVMASCGGNGGGSLLETTQVSTTETQETKETQTSSIEITEPTEITEAYNAIEFEGEYIANQTSTISVRKSGDQYILNIFIYRLTSFDNVIAQVGESGNELEFTATIMSGNNVRGKLYWINSDLVTMEIVESAWNLLPSGTAEAFTRIVEQEETENNYAESIPVDVMETGSLFTIKGRVEYHNVSDNIGNKYYSVTCDTERSYFYRNANNEFKEYSSNKFFVTGNDLDKLDGYAGQTVFITGYFFTESRGIPYITDIVVFR